MDFKNPEILASAFNYSELLSKERFLIQEQRPEINVDPFTPLQYVDFMSNHWLMLSCYVDTCFVHCCWC